MPEGSGEYFTPLFTVPTPSAIFRLPQEYVGVSEGHSGKCRFVEATVQEQ